MFMLGLAGDSDPYPRGNRNTPKQQEMAYAKQHGLELSTEVDRVLQSKLRPVHGPLHVAYGKMDLPLEAPPSREELEKRAAQTENPRAAAFATRMLEILKQNGKLPDHVTAPLAVWQFGQDLTLVALSSEVVVDFVFLLEKALGPTNLWLSAYSNDWFGYVPSARVLSEGGYETGGYQGIRFSAKAQDVLVAKARELAERVGRPGVGQK
jgi:hypothetical protein